MPLREDHWLSEVIGTPVFRVEHPSDADALEADVARRARAMYFAKLDASDVRGASTLVRAGMYPTEVHVTLARRPAGGGSSSGSARITEAVPEQHEAVLRIASTCFRYSRFHLDPLVPDGVANEIKRRWVQSYVRKERGDRLLVAEMDGSPAGFLAALTSERDGRRVAIIDLVGVGLPAQRRGVGIALVAAFVEEYADRADVLEVGTQIVNTPSLALYRACGFEIIRSGITLHMHASDGCVVPC